MSKQTSLEELGRRAVACKHWRWMPGMLHGIEAMDETLYVSRFSEFSIYADDDGRIPILSDPATLGCLLHLVREAWEEATVYVEHDKCRRRPWVAILPMLVIDCDTEAEALVAALEEAP